MSQKNPAESWLKLAAEARAKAKRMRTSYARVLMLEEAAKYEQLAQQAACGGKENHALGFPSVSSGDACRKGPHKGDSDSPYRSSRGRIRPVSTRPANGLPHA